jgi:hypothetical protein
LTLDERLKRWADDFEVSLKTFEGRVSPEKEKCKEKLGDRTSRKSGSGSGATPQMQKTYGSTYILELTKIDVYQCAWPITVAL